MSTKHRTWLHSAVWCTLVVACIVYGETNDNAAAAAQVLLWIRCGILLLFYWYVSQYTRDAASTLSDFDRQRLNSSVVLFVSINITLAILVIVFLDAWILASAFTITTLLHLESIERLKKYFEDNEPETQS